MLLYLWGIKRLPVAQILEFFMKQETAFRGMGRKAEQYGDKNKQNFTYLYAGLHG